MSPRRKQKAANHSDASPAKSLADDLGHLRRVLRKTARAYTRRLDQDIVSVMEWAHSAFNSRKVARSRIRDLGDMLALVRRIEAKPDKGRRKDLKKIDSVVNELRFFIEHDRQS
jgi:hypothetical protein